MEARMATSISAAVDMKIVDEGGGAHLHVTVTYRCQASLASDKVQKRRWHENSFQCGLPCRSPTFTNPPPRHNRQPTTRRPHPCSVLNFGFPASTYVLTYSSQFIVLLPMPPKPNLSPTTHAPTYAVHYQASPAPSHHCIRLLLLFIDVFLFFSFFFPYS